MGLSNGQNGGKDRTIEYAPRGSFCKITDPIGTSGRTRETKRGRVSGFSARSRARLTQLVTKVPNDTLSRALFLTLTYPADWPDDPTEWKRHLHNFGRELKDEYKGISAIWKLEPQKRGAPHFHLLVFNCPFLPIVDISERWHRIIGSDDYNHLAAGVDIDKVSNARNAVAYVSKYIAKVPDATDHTTGEIVSWEYPGRWWGVINRDALPVDVVTLMPSWKSWWTVKRWLRKYMERRGKPQCFSGMGGGWVILDGGRVVKLLDLAGALAT